MQENDAQVASRTAERTGLPGPEPGNVPGETSEAGAGTLTR